MSSSPTWPVGLPRPPFSSLPYMGILSLHAAERDYYVYVSAASAALQQRRREAAPHKCLSLGQVCVCVVAYYNFQQRFFLV